jgi:hypothetical protein
VSGALAAADQKALERAGHVPAMFKRPNPLALQSAGQSTSAANRRAPTWTVVSAKTCPVAASLAAMLCELLWVSAPSTIMAAVPSVLT